MTQNEDKQDEEPDIPMSEIADKQYIGFSVKAPATEENYKYHKWFRESAKKYAGNNYTTFLAICKQAFEHWQSKSSVEREIDRLHARIDQLEEHLMAKEKDDDTDEEDEDGTF